MNPYLEILLACFLFAWFLKGVVNFAVGILQILAGVICVVAVVLWATAVAIVSLPMIFLPIRSVSPQGG